MNFKSLSTVLLFVCFFHGMAEAQNGSNRKNNRIVIEVELPENFRRERIHIDYLPYDAMPHDDRDSGNVELHGNIARWILFSDRPLIVDLRLMLDAQNVGYIYEPGDSIHIDFKGGRKVKAVYSGTGAVKFNMLQELRAQQALLTLPPNPYFETTLSLEDFREWNNYLDRSLDQMDKTFALYKSKLPESTWDYLKADEITDTEYQRLMKFGALVPRLLYKAKPGAGEQLAAIFDSTATNKHVQWLFTYTGVTRNAYYFYDYVRRSIQRQYNFNTAHKDLEGVGRKLLYTDLAKKIYKGRMLQNFWVYLVTGQGIKEHNLKEGSVPEIEQLLNEFYATPGYPEHKAYVKKYDQMYREWIISEGHTAPGFSLEDQNGKLYSKKDFKNRIVVLGFFDDSERSREAMAELKKTQQKFENNKDVLFINVSTEKNKTAWLKNISHEQSGADNIVNLYTNGLGKNHPVLKYYNVKDYPQFNVNAYPRLFLIDKYGKFIYSGEVGKGAFTLPLKLRKQETFPDPRKDNGQVLSAKIFQKLALLKDGPYVLTEQDGIKTYSINTAGIDTKKYNSKNDVQLTVQTDDYHTTFPVTLQDSLRVEPAEFVRPEKLFVLSDIEGNFDAFRKLLQSNKIIDEKLNWIFGKGHLVFAGDMFDRGLQVTECLWLIYSLEEKAKAAGGYVHFVLGNHEIMNLQGNHRYVEDKYEENATLLNKTLTQLYNEESELGKWLRTKNIVEKIGDLLFAHGGIAPEINAYNFTVENMNSIARPYYANAKTENLPDERIEVLYSGETSPFWYRSYYKGDDFSNTSKRWVYKAKESVIDRSLKKFNVKHIITGHSIVADTISIHYGGKVINTDTKHAEGKSEALLIEGKYFYRVNDKGNRVLLFKEEDAPKPF